MKKDNSLLNLTMLLFCLLLFVSYKSFAVTAHVTWDASTSAPADIGGYNVFYGTSSGVYGDPMDAGNNLTVDITGLLANTNYYIAAKAYPSPTSLLTESVFSNEVVFFNSPPLPPSPTTFNIGQDTVFPDIDGSNGGLLLAQKVILTQDGVIQSLSFNVVSASGTLILGIYDATGSSGGPGALKATTVSFTPVAGWNTANVITPIKLLAGTYWLAYQPSSSSLSFSVDYTIGTFVLEPHTGALPATFPTVSGFGVTNWSLYAALTTKPIINPPTNLHLTQ